LNSPRAARSDAPEEFLLSTHTTPRAPLGSIAGTRRSNRNHQFDLLRILFATLVLLAHAPELTDGNISRELLHRLTGSPVTFGALGVDGFFVLSGYLIAASWLGDPKLFNFLCKRVLRIVPGYLVAVFLSTIAVGILAPGVERFFAGLNVHFLISVVLLRSPATPPVFPGRPYAMVNGALYTIGYEFRCYLLVAVLGLCGLLRRPIACLVVAVLLLSSLVYPAPFWRIHWPMHLEALLGQPGVALRLTAIYLVGVCFYQFRDRLVFRPWLGWSAALMLVGVFALAPPLGEFALVLCGGYLMFYLGQMRLPGLSWMSGFPDISYGIYLYGWPVESLWIVPQRLALDHVSCFHGHLLWPGLAELALCRASRAYVETKTHCAASSCLSLAKRSRGADDW
jgi:peptidoglycan/LPS O-acetylase OafA/YrhL